ncbi:MAG: type II CAAX endopeptidase family protein [Thermodesulfobacteriota bacterium]|nr:type II CAAX endopeptidase family protein [Thermodesulfobacteriota bacterium]
METDRIKIKTVLVSLAVIAVIEVVAGVAVFGGAYDPLLILGVTRLLEIISIVLAVLILEGGMSFIGFSISGVTFGLKKGFIWSAGFGILVLLVSAALFAFGINPIALVHTRLPAGQGEIIIFFLVGGIISPVAEEVFFRGVIYGFFRRWGIFVAITLSTLAFVLAHPLGPGIPLPQITGGILFAVSYEKEGNLLVPITIHILGNMAIFSLSLMS